MELHSEHSVCVCIIHAIEIYSYFSNPNPLCVLYATKLYISKEFRSGQRNETNLIVCIALCSNVYVLKPDSLDKSVFNYFAFV